MKLFTKEILQKLTRNHEATMEAEGGDLNHLPVVKLYDPFGGAVWLLSEYDPAYDNAFGLCDLGMGCPELGSVSMSEIRSLKNFMGHRRIERDMHWSPEGHSLSEFAILARRLGGTASYFPPGVAA